MIFELLILSKGQIRDRLNIFATCIEIEKSRSLTAEELFLGRKDRIQTCRRWIWSPRRLSRNNFFKREEINNINVFEGHL